MGWSDLITLRKTEISYDSNGFKQTKVKDKTVYANKKSVTRSEFWAAHSNGVSADAVFEIYGFEYDDNSEIIYNKDIYDVIRVYETNNDFIELTCSRRAK